MSASSSSSQSALAGLAIAIGLAMGCGAARFPPRFALGEGEIAIGTPGRTEVLAASVPRRWAVIRQARTDTNADGRVCAYTDGHHGFEWGDAPTLWLVVDGGLGEAIDEFYGSTDDGRFLVIAERGEVVVVDFDGGARTPVGRASTRPTWPHHEPSASAALAGTLLALRASATEADVIDLATTTRHAYPIASGWLHDAFATEDGWIVAEVLDRAPSDETSPDERPHMETSGGPLPCNLANGACLGPPGRVVLGRLDDRRVWDVRTDGVSLAPWGFVDADAERALRVTLLAEGVTLPLTDPGCAAQMLFIGHESRVVAYRCEGTGDMHVALASGEAPPTMLDLSDGIGGDAAAWRARGVAAADADMLETIPSSVGTYVMAGHATSVLRRREAGRPHVEVRQPWCDEDVGRYSEEDYVCVVAAEPDGTALGRRHVPSSPRASCAGDEDQLVWTRVRLADDGTAGSDGTTR